MIDRTSLRAVETCATAAPGPAINVWPRGKRSIAAIVWLVWQVIR